MRKAGRLVGELADDGQQVGDGAAIIAATSMIVEEPVLTRNAADFERRGVEVETY